jgi:iron complex transport system permease protein
MQRKHYILLATLALAALLLIDLWPKDLSLITFWGSEIFVELRLPRVISAMIGGIALGWSGLMMQTLFRNPLAGPFLIGITPGATFGVALTTYLGSSLGLNETLSQMAIQPLAALGGAFLVLGIQLALHKKLTQMHSLLLVGLVLGYFFGAAVDIITQTAQAQQVKQFVMWGMGSFDRVLLFELIPLGLTTLLGGLILIYHKHTFNTYLLGDIHVESAGKSAKSIRSWLIVGSASMAAVVTAFCGPISFVGLIAPHISRKINGSESHQKNIFTTAITGASLTVAADIIAHNAIPNSTLPVNAILSIIGAPLVIFMLARKH